VIYLILLLLVFVLGLAVSMAKAEPMPLDMEEEEERMNRRSQFRVIYSEHIVRPRAVGDRLKDRGGVL
jgi:hypothetical protein